MKVKTGYLDHTGKDIYLDSKCTMDAGHAHCDDWAGSIVLQEDGSVQFVEDGIQKDMGCLIQECNHLLEVV